MYRPKRATKKPLKFRDDDEDAPESPAKRGKKIPTKPATSTKSKSRTKQPMSKTRQVRDDTTTTTSTQGSSRPTTTSHDDDGQSQVQQQKTTKKTTSKPSKVGKGQAFSAEELQLIRQNAEDRKKHLNDLVDNLTEDQCKELLKEIAGEQPGFILDIMNINRVRDEEAEETPGPSNRPDPRPQPGWCVCGNCRLMANAIEEVCCRQRRQNCVAMTPEMRHMCIDNHILHMSMLTRADILAIRNIREDDARLRNRSYRYAGYRQFTMWQHGRLGHGVRRVIPSCCIWKVRDVYPDPSGQYVPFRPGAFE